MDDSLQHKTPPRPRDSKPNPRRFKRIKKMSSLFFYLLLIGFICLCILLLYLRSQSLPTAYISQTSQVLDFHGHVIDSFHIGQNRQIIDLEQMSPYILDATLAIEDHRFYNHVGFDMIGVARAAWVDIQHMSMVQGASSITQQLARNLYLTHEKTWTRKIKEALYTIQLEMQYSKKDILEQYLNQIYYGHAAYGIQAAAQLYFNKDAADLSLAESALLAGVPKGPKYYSPYMDENNAKARQRIVLQAMVTREYVTEKEANLALQEELIYQPLQGSKPSEAPYFRDYIRQQAMTTLNIDEKTFNEGGYQIHTTLDIRVQNIAEEVVDKHLKNTDLQVALIAIDPRNGYVKAMVGGRDYEENQYNRVFASTRQPGSSFKPVVYLAALQNPAFSAVTQFKSEPTVFSYDDGKENYMPRNFGNRYPHDYIDLRYAISKSDNIYAVHTIMHIGPDQVIDTARKLGIQSYMQPLPSLALGTYPVSPFEMASAFATIANQGARYQPQAIVRIEDGRGQILYESHVQSEQVVDSASTYVLTSMMESVFDQGGTGNRVSSTLKRPVAGKTGTTNTDSWMVGFTPELSTAVWIGYDRDRSISSVESHLAAPIFAEFTEQTLEAVPPKLFKVPDNVVSFYIDPVSGKIATAECPNPRLEHFVKGTEPLEYCTSHNNPIEIEDIPSPEIKHGDHQDSWWKDLKRWWNE
jgi:1A family penicillin-binding protein